MARVLLTGSAILIGVGLSLVAASCDDAPPPPRPADPDPEPPIEAVGSVRRPAETYLMTRTGERCEVTIVVDGEVVERLPTAYACPKDLEIGEWIRLAGMTCIREGGPVERKVPVVCPDYLTNAERDLRKAREAAKDGGK